MNTRYTEIFLFLSRLSRRSNKGFAMGFVLMVGVLMAATGAVMLLRSGSEREKVVAQQNTAKGIAKAEVGVTRIRFFLNQQQHQQLIKTEFGEWQTVADEISASGSSSSSSSSSDSNQLQGITCDGSGGSGGSSSSSSSSSSASGFSDAFDTGMFNKLIGQQWIPVNASDPSAGEFRLTSYELETPAPTPEEPNPEPTMVTLEVEARGLNQDDSSDLKSNNSVRAISVDLPIIELSTEEEAEASLTPGLWISDTTNGSGGQNDNSKQSSGPQGPINAVTWIDCSQNSDWNSSQSYVNNSKLDPTPIQIGDTTINPAQNGGVKRIKDDMLPIPSRPSSGVKNMGSKDWSDCYAVLPRISGNSSTCSVGSGTDSPVGDIYYYRFTGDDSIKLSNAQIQIKPPPGKKVVIFIQGGITMSGTSKPSGGQRVKCRSGSGTKNVVTFIGDPEDPSKLELYSESREKPIDISDTTMISGFVHAPKTELKISQAQVRGAAWVKRMDASNSEGSGCDRSIKQMDVGQTLVVGGGDGEPQSFTTLGQVSSYRSVQVKTGTEE